MTVNSLLGYTLSVPDIAAGKRFYEDFGLISQGHGDRLDCKVQPWRLGHVLFFSPDVGRQIAFYTDTLGMKLSDRSGDIIAFIRPPGGSDHHVIAFAKSDRPGFHHASYEVGSVDQVGHGA